MVLSYEFSIGSVRAREKNLLTSSDIEQMLSYNNTSDLARFLNDKGYGDGETIDEILKNRTDSVWEYLRSVVPDFSIFNPFLIENDTHNFKVILKGIMSGRKREELFLEPCTIETDILKEAVEHKKFNLLPYWLNNSAKQAYEIITHKTDARECDAVIDKAAMEQMLELSKKFTSNFISDYFNTLIFYNNIKIAIRSSKTKVDADFLNKALCDVNEFRKSSVITATLKGTDYLLDELSKYSEYDCKTAIESYKISPSAFEKFVDDKLIKMAVESCKRASEGPEPLIGYYLGFEVEKKVIHIIESGIRTATDKEIIRERLREVYG
ncbi:MAG: V-type ATPase subunit [Ruminococcus sp.]|nr:V-type ATPase subunit [Ruminococcus sp.]